jgi:flagellar biosynthesis chaperone FliJ
MKTRFADLLKVKKQKLDEVERQLLDVQNRKRNLEKKIEQVDCEIKLLELPQSGEFGLMQMSREGFLSLISQKEQLTEKLLLREQQIEGLKILYKEVTIEYEKIAYLEEEEMQKEMRRVKVEESKNLDEIANILFVNKQKKVST